MLNAYESDVCRGCCCLLIGHFVMFVSFQIQDGSECPTNSATVSKYCQRNIDVTNFLNLHSLRDHSEFCLAYMFTHRDFTGGTLGLAWVGSPSR